MKAIVTRDMNVMNAKGENEQFVKAKNDEDFIEIDADTYRRLNRAGAAVVYIEETGDEGEGDDTTEDTVESLMKMKKEDLAEKAKAAGVEVNDGDTKKVTAEAIMATRTA